MKHSSDLEVEADAETIVETLSDLSTYPLWNDLVSAASATPAIDGDEGPAWLTTLRAQVGPFARSKQLRFVRDDHLVAPEIDGWLIRFVRREADERTHASWTMDVQVTDLAGPMSAVTLTLSYDGGLWVPALGAILGGAIDRATVRLPAYLETRKR